MDCYDYKTQAACERNRCAIGSPIGCEWRVLNNEIGSGACIDPIIDNCLYCDKAGTFGADTKAYNSLFSACTAEKAQLLSTEDHVCAYEGGFAKDCSAVSCMDQTKCYANSEIILKADNTYAHAPGT